MKRHGRAWCWGTIDRIEAYTLCIITAEPRADVTEAVIAAMCAFESLHEKTPEARVGCAKAVETLLRLVLRLERMARDGRAFGWPS